MTRSDHFGRESYIPTPSPTEREGPPLGGTVYVPGLFSREPRRQLSAYRLRAIWAIRSAGLVKTGLNRWQGPD